MQYSIVRKDVGDGYYLVRGSAKKVDENTVELDVVALSEGMSVRSFFQNIDGAWKVMPISAFEVGDSIECDFGIDAMQWFNTYIAFINVYKTMPVDFKLDMLFLKKEIFGELPYRIYYEDIGFAKVFHLVEGATCMEVNGKLRPRIVCWCSCLSDAVHKKVNCEFHDETVYSARKQKKLGSLEFESKFARRVDAIQWFKTKVSELATTTYRRKIVGEDEGVPYEFVFSVESNKMWRRVRA